MTIGLPDPRILDINAITAVCGCGTWMAYDTNDNADRISAYRHADACRDCHDPVTGKAIGDAPCEHPHTCPTPMPVGCDHGCIDRIMAVGTDGRVAHDDAGYVVLRTATTIASPFAVCGDDLDNCCGGCGCQPDDVEPGYDD